MVESWGVKRTVVRSGVVEGSCALYLESVSLPSKGVGTKFLFSASTG